MAKRLMCRLGRHRLARQVAEDGSVYGECVCGKRDYEHWVSDLPGDHDPGIVPPKSGGGFFSGGIGPGGSPM
jgi:hypothetical protein